MKPSRRIVVVAVSAVVFLGAAGARNKPLSAQRDPSVVAESDIPADVSRDSMARLPLLEREALDPEGQRAYDVVVDPKSRYSGGLRGPVAMWLYAPKMAEHIFPASTYLRFGTDKDQRLTELTILTAAREMKSQYEWTQHEPAARRAGLQGDIIDLVRDRKPLEGVAGVTGLGDRERLIIDLVREVVSQEKLSSATYARAVTLLGKKGVMDLAGLVGYYSFVNITLKTFDVQLAPGSKRLLPDLW